MRQCSPGVDGVTKELAEPAASMLLPEVTALFCYLYLHGICVEDWCLSVVVSVKKKGDDLVDMDNFRGVHLLSFSGNGSLRA